MKKRFYLLLLVCVLALSACAQSSQPAPQANAIPETHVIPYPENYPTAQDEYGASAFAGALNHADSKYYVIHDFYNMKSGGSLHILSNFETYQQTTEYTCGPSCALMVLHWFGEDGYDEMQIADLVEIDTSKGTSVEGMAKFFNGLGWNVDYHAGTDYRFGDIEAAKAYFLEQLDAGVPVMTDWEDWAGHWQVVIGLDECGSDAPYDDVLILADPYDVTDHCQDGYYTYPLGRFFDMWREGPCVQKAEPYNQAFVTAKPSVDGGTVPQDQAPAEPQSANRPDAALSLWTDAAPAKAALTAYMDAITDENGSEFIPVENRIAVFDLDGTLFCETDPNYFDYTLLKYRVLEDPDYKDKASDFEKEVANKIKEQNETGQSFAGLEVDHGRAVASAFSGMTVQEFNDYIQEFKKQPMPSYDGMLRGGGWYQPMLEIVDYLKEHDFKVYVVSGTDRLIVRGIAYDSPLNLPNSQIIGSDETIIATGQGNEDGLNYVFTDGDQLVLGGDFLIKNLKMNKVSVIMQEIGQQPVLSFGNSTGDSSMAEYVTSGNPYKSLAFMLCCDDTERENGNEAKAQKMFDLCEEFDWVPVSMKNDWTTIYGDGVTKK